MTPHKAQEVLDAIIGQITGYQNPYSLEQFMQKFAFDIRLPLPVQDSTTGEQTWTASINPTKFITKQNSMERVDSWERPKQQLGGMQDILAAWEETNYRTTERHIESDNVLESDNVYNSQSVFRSQDIHRSKNIILSDSIHDSENLVASQRSQSSTNSVRVEDSSDVANSFNVVWSKKISNSLFINDCFDMYECMFCSHMSGKKFCIANMQYTEEEYYGLKKQVLEWLLGQ